MNVTLMGEGLGRDAIASHLRQGAAVRLAVIEECLPAIVEAADMMVRCLNAGGTVFFCGNGGSAADSQHLAAELVGRYQRDRRAMAAIALTTDTSVITAVGNDHSFASVFERQVHALVRRGDVLVALSTSGQSESVVRAIAAARLQGATVIGMTGSDDSRVASGADIAIRVPSTSTPFIQEAHIAIGHAICGVVEPTILTDPEVRPSV
jgi:D-sedoheptulose 7-phosphate isomerase